MPKLNLHIHVIGVALITLSLVACMYGQNTSPSVQLSVNSVNLDTSSIHRPTYGREAKIYLCTADQSSFDRNLIASASEVETDGNIVGGTAEQVVHPAAFCSSPPSQFYTQYRNFIPADHIAGPFNCHLGGNMMMGKSYGGLIFIGDTSTFASHYRVKETVNALDGPQNTPEPTVQITPGETLDFQTPSSPVNGSYANLSAGDFRDSRNPNPAGRGPLELCDRENGEAHANTNNVHGSVTANTNSLAVYFNGYANDPLASSGMSIGAINWDVTATINSAANSVSITGSHDCFPSHEVQIGSQVVYRFTPARVTPTELRNCLTGLYPPHQISCSTVPLDGTSICKN